VWPMQYWLVKQEPNDYSWQALVKQGRTAWTGVRNFQARNHLRNMKRGDAVLFYHTGAERQVVGVASVVREAYADPTATEGDWACVDLVPAKPLSRPVTLEQIKADKMLQHVSLVKQPRLSVMPLTRELAARILELAGTPLP
jgi:predicted RNA-binding protein with PUA-like domain